MSSEAPRLWVTAIERFERDVILRLPFRFGVTTLERAPQAFLRARIRLEDGTESDGLAAEMLAPKWFDKNLTLSNEDNFDQLRRSLRLACESYLQAGPATAFGLFAACHRTHVDACATNDLNPLIASFGQALVDRAVLDALCRARNTAFDAALRANLPGIEAGPAEDLAGFDFASFLAGLRPAHRIHVRHTVGMVDPITAGDLPAERRIGDGLPEILEEVVAFYGNRYFKLKVGGDLERDLARLEAIAGVLGGIEDPYHSTLDGNEQYADPENLAALLDALDRSARLRRLRESILFVEQPIARGSALSTDVRVLARRLPLIIDESDAELDAFRRARGLGYTGVSSKACKGVYRSVLNAARCALWNAEGGARHFMSAEDLTTQAGIAVQQDTALAAAIGCRHVERNGHHYVNGMAALPDAEQRAFLEAHADLYHRSHGAVRLRIERGELAIGSLFGPGFASAAWPRLDDMRAMPEV